jgi:hypothetical protein
MNIGYSARRNLQFLTPRCACAPQPRCVFPPPREANIFQVRFLLNFFYSVFSYRARKKAGREGLSVLISSACKICPGQKLLSTRNGWYHLALPPSHRPVRAAQQCKAGEEKRGESGRAGTGAARGEGRGEGGGEGGEGRGGG